MKQYINLTFNNNTYNICYEDADASGVGCIREIIMNNEYLLDNFNNLSTHIIDIGANCGIATIILAKQNPQSKVYSFEPDYNVFKLLEENVKINNLTNVILSNCAMSSPNTKFLELCHHPQYSGGNTTYSDRDSFRSFFNMENIHISRVECVSLDEIIDKYNIDNIELLKIDCEGAEYDILYSSEYIKQNKIKNIVGEFHNLKYNNKVSNSAEGLINYAKSYISGIFKIQILNI